ncbi:PrsW family glutamic-type intramembrane protease [[Eubacterium] cellulosolvens]
MNLTELFVAAVIPSVFILLLIVKKDRFEREPFRLLLATFIFGALSIIPAVFIELYLSNFLAEPEEPLSDIIGLILHYLIVVAIVEESCKFFATLPAYGSKAFNEPMDGIVYAVTSSLGFATIENIIYVLSGGWLIAILRASLSVPGHALFGATMGYYLGRSKFVYRWRMITFAIIIPIFLHTIYNIIISMELGLINLAFGIIFIFFLYHRVKRHIGTAQEISPFNPKKESFCIYCGSNIFLTWRYCPKCGREIGQLLL